MDTASPMAMMLAKSLSSAWRENLATILPTRCRLKSKQIMVDFVIFDEIFVLGRLSVDEKE